MARMAFVSSIEVEIRGVPPGMRRTIRQQRSKPVIKVLTPWLEPCQGAGKLADAIRCGLIQWDGLCRYFQWRINVKLQCRP